MGLQYKLIYCLPLAAVSLGILGLVLGTFGCGLLAWMYGLRSRRKSIPASHCSVRDPLSLDVLIPAHNEERVIVATLQSITAAAKQARASGASVTLRIIVALDHCTDHTRLLVESFSSQCEWPIQLIENNGEAGKWQALTALMKAGEREWLALVDAGSVWHSDLLTACLPHFSSSDVLGVAPSYIPRQAGVIERAHWVLEQLTKRLENLSGGPVSVHGATVFYRRSPLQETLKSLSGKAWLNDDVVIPLMLRLRSPSRRLVYLAKGLHEGWVNDLGLQSDPALELRRRERIAAGNMQWISGILLGSLREDPRVVLLAFRRVFRLLWAYWLILLALGAGGALVAAALESPAVSGASLEAIVGALITLGYLLHGRLERLKKLAAVFLSGLRVPALLWNLKHNKGVSWN